MLYLLPPDRRFGPNDRVPMRQLAEAVTYWPQLLVTLRRYYRRLRVRGFTPGMARAIILNLLTAGMTAEVTVQAHQIKAREVAA